MINELITLNNPQQISVINNPISEVDIWGRGTGKSFIVGWEINEINRRMPRAVTSITGQTYGQLLTRTLPSTFKFLESLGYEKDKDYLIGKKPPKGWLSPYERILKYDNFISFKNGNGYLMLSQDRAGSARGPNVDREIVDEALTIDKTQYDQEVSPTSRGNEEYFGFKSPAPVRQHHGFRYVSSMPFMQEQKWLLDYGKYYEEEAGILLFDIWNRIVKLQLELITAYLDNKPQLYKDIWNEVVRLKRQITPFVSKDGILFTLANAFDNITNLGMSYIAREYKKQTLLTFLVEIMNWIIDRVEDCYYHIDSQKHVYYDATNDSFIRDYAENTNWDFAKLEKHDSRFDLDCDSSKPLEVVPDWGAHICLFSIGQERNYNFVTRIVEPVDCVINEFYSKPDESPEVVIDDVVDKVSAYYEHHTCRDIFYFRDRYGDSKQPNAKKSKPYNEQAIERFQKNGWNVFPRVHKGQEPPQHEKYLLWSNILKGTNPGYPKVIFNGRNCKYTLISMNNTRVIEKDGKYEKDKSSERKKTILPEEATHFSDAVDKRIWTKYGNRLYRTSTFVEPRI
ncbi:MAG: hypothetical protein FD166_1445 [Bacteroidetes bacterium]|nr:MAG: hypothetical protein FD166_1445 [Bacteroidota bacterium]